MNSEINTFGLPPSTWRDRLRRRFVPMRYCEAPDATGVTGRGDCVCVRTHVVLDWRDRVRVLLTGKLIVES